jgi:hypothetical protein
MTNIMTILPGQVRGIRKLFFCWVRRPYGGVVPGVFQVLASRPDSRGRQVLRGTKELRAV